MIKYGEVQFCEGGPTPLAHIDSHRWGHTQGGESKSGGTPDFILEIPDFKFFACEQSLLLSRLLIC